MDLEEARDISKMGWPENQKAQRQHDAVDWLCAEVDRLLENVAHQSAVNTELRAELSRAKHKWETGFVCGYVCAAANVIRTHDLPTVALDLLKEGIGNEDISSVDESDIETLVSSDSRIAAYLRRD